MLAGRRGDRAPSLRSPLLGLVLLGVGIAGSAFGAASGAGGEFAIAASAIPAVLGMILLVPMVLALIARLSGRLPLVLRYAVRDANRHRTRTVPRSPRWPRRWPGWSRSESASRSDDAENEATYQPSVAAGVGIVTAYDPDVSWQALRGVLDRELPGATVTEQRGLAEDESFSEVFGPEGETVLDTSGSSLGANIMVSDGKLPGRAARGGPARRRPRRADAAAGRHGRVRLSRPLGRRGHRDRGPAPATTRTPAKTPGPTARSCRLPSSS